MTASASNAPWGKPARAGGAILRPEVGPLARPKAATETIQSPSPVQIAMLRLREDLTFKISLAIFVSILVVVACAPLIEKWVGRTAMEQNLSGKIQMGGKSKEAVKIDGRPNIGPGFHKQYMLGSDALGRDVFLRALRGGRVSLFAGFGAAFIGMFGAILLGTLAGYKRGMWDTIISRWADFMMCFPMLLLLVAMSTALATRDIALIHRGSLGLLVLIMGVGAIPGMTRVIRSLVLSQAEKEFVEAAKALGGNDWRIMARHMLPNISNSLVTFFGLMICGTIIGEAGLSYLGLGILPPGMSWGTGIGDGTTYYTVAWWITLVPGTFIILTAASVNLIGMAVEEAFDPKNLESK